jgi:ribosomal-protein-alanine N-acetyltransferase
MDSVLETSRLILRQISMADLDFLAAMMTDAEVMRYYPKRYTRDEVEAWIHRQEEHYAKHGHGVWLVLDKLTCQPVGRVGLSQQMVEGVEMPEVGYMIHRPYWRRGLATEAATATRDYAFFKLDKPRVISLVRPINLPSQGVARKIGMQPEDHLVQHGGFDHLVFTVSREATTSPQHQQGP